MSPFPWQVANYLRNEKRMQCNCDLDNWEPTRETNHSHVCRIHKAAKAASPELKLEVAEHLAKGKAQ